MARNTVGLPPGVEIRNGSIRIRFTQGKQRCSETLPYPATQAGIQTASRLRDQVVSLNKLGLLDESKYAELFPNSRTSNTGTTFGEYAQIWLDSKSIVSGTRSNYKYALNKWLMPYMATKQFSEITPLYLRKYFTEVTWKSAQAKINVMKRLSTILASAVSDGLLPKHPMDNLELPTKPVKKIYPFTQEEANQIIQHMYQHPTKVMRIYAAYFEFAFYTGMRPAEITALRWSEVDLVKKTANVCRIVAKSKIEERTKTKKPRVVLLNARAIQALRYALQHIEEVKTLKHGLADYPYCFPPAKAHPYIHDTKTLHRGWKDMLKELGIAYRPPYNARHTYATLCLMSGLAPAFIAKQLGHSVKILLSTYADWLSGSDDWNQMDKLNIGPKLPQDIL